MVTNVLTIPNAYPLKQNKKYGVLIFLTYLSFNKHLSMSNFKHNATNIPGITISPNPNIENLGGSAVRSIGNNNFIGASKDLATVIITSVP